MRTKEEMLRRDVTEGFPPAYITWVPPKEERPPTVFDRVKARIRSWF